MMGFIAGLVFMCAIGIVVGTWTLADIERRLKDIHTVLRREEEYGKLHRAAERSRKALGL